MRNSYSYKQILVWIFIFVCGCELHGQATQTYISKEMVARHLNFLGSDLFEGRGTGTTGGNLTAKYLGLEFEKINLKPMGSNNTFYQYVPMHGSQPLAASELKIYNNGEEKPLLLFEDYFLFNAGDQTFVPNPLPTVFVGFGIIAPEYDYNDYENVNVEGKIVVMLDGEPQSDDETFFEGVNPSVYSFPESKKITALSRGARGSIIILHQKEQQEDWNKLKREYYFEDISLAYSPNSHLSILLNPKAAEEIFSGSAISFQKVLEDSKEHRTKSFDLAAEISFKGDFERRDFLSPNIIGMIDGEERDLKNEYIILSAHYDHLGIGAPAENDSIYNGVMDNAIGVAVLLEIAKYFSNAKKALKRSIIFMPVTGEEKGLLGSLYYTDHPVVPLHKTIASINIDGVPFLDEFNSVVGVGAELSTLGEALEKVAGRLKINTGTIPQGFIQTESFSRSDQVVFAKAGVPSLLIMDLPDYKNISRQEGLQILKHYAENIYHTPFDDLSQNINYDAVEQFAQIIIELIKEIANAEEPPQWHDNTPYSITRLRTIAEKK